MARGNFLSAKPPIGARVGLHQLLPGRFGTQPGPLDLYTRVGRSYSGEIARLQLPLGNEQWVLSNPEHVGYVLKDNQKNYLKGKEYGVLGMVAPEGLLSAEGDTWREHRRRMQPAFKPTNIDAVAGVMIFEAEAMLERWQSHYTMDGPIDICQQMRDLTLRIVTRTLFSSDLDLQRTEQVAREFGYLNWYLDDRMGGLIHAPSIVPTRKNLRYRRAVKALDEVVYGIIETRRRLERMDKLPTAEHQDLLGMLMATRDEETQGKTSDAQLRDQVITLLIAGHDTTANALSWAWYLLSQHPDVQQALHQEVDEVLGSRSPVASDFKRLDYTKMVFDEVLRLYPPAWLISRRPLAADRIGGYDVPADTQLMISPYVTHRDPRLWTEPGTFDPARFAADRSTERAEFAHFPFGGGARQCLGKGFARMEAVLVLATVAQQHRLVATSDSTVSPEAVLTLRPRNGMRLSVERR